MLRIGELEFDLPVVQAALSGYSDVAMRRMARMFGAPYTLNEVVLDQTVVTGGRKQRKILSVDEGDHPVGGQLMGAEPRQFAAAGDMLVEAGYDVVDINFGCPVRKVLGRCRGGFLLSQPDTALEIVRSVYDAVGGRRPVTLKMRRGMDDSPESERNFFHILDGAFEIGLAAVTVHGRTVKQRYVGRSKWAFLRQVKRHVGDRVILGSGDLFGATDVKRMLDETGVDGVTVARGCIGNPWIFEECRAVLAGEPLPEPPSVVEQGRAIGQHFDFACQLHGEALASRMMRKFGIKYSELHPNGRQVRDAFVSIHSAADWRAVLDRWYSPEADWSAPVRKRGPGDLVAAGAV